MSDRRITDAWDRIDQIFHGAAGLDGDAQQEYLDRHCGADAGLRREVESLLAWAQEDEEITVQALAPHRWMAAELSAELERVQGIRLESGDNLGSYQLLEALGQGGMSRVFLAERADDQYHMRVAVKVLRPGLDSADMLARLRQERQILASLNHPHIAHLLDGGSTPAGAPFFVLEYVPGEPIDTYCDRHQLPVRPCLELFLKVCGAVQYAHRNLIIHRDLKPSNLLVTPDGEPKLLDFGIAKLLNPEAFPLTVSKTQLGARLLTPEYASPEQFQGTELNTATDIYSLGMILYRLLTGRLPFPSEGRTLGMLERQVCEVPPPLPSQSSQAAEAWDPGRGRQLRGDLDRILLKALEKDPEQRYASVERFADDLRCYLAGLPVSVQPPSLIYRTHRFISRHRAVFTAATLVVLLLVGVVTYYTVRLRSERDAARQLAERLSRFMGFVEEVVTNSDPSSTSAQEVTVREVVDRLAERNAELESEPALRAAVMNQVGRLYRYLALYSEAESQMSQALEIRRELSRKEGRAPGLDVAESAKELGDTRYFLGQLDSAEDLLTEAWEIRRRLLGSDDPLTVNTENDLAALLETRGRHEEAEARFRDVLARRQAQARESLGVAETLSNLAAVRWSLGDLAEAETLYRQALEVGRRVKGPLHRDVNTTLNNLAALLSARGNHEEAERLFAEALASNRRLYGDRHPYISRGLERRARERRALGRWQEAMDDYREALWLHQEIAPADPRLLRWRLDFASLLVEQGDCGAAAPLLEQVLASSPDDAAALEMTATCAATISRSGSPPAPESKRHPDSPGTGG